MAQRVKMFSEADLKAIHKATVEILSETGVEFPDEKSRDVFRQHGFKVDGHTVFIDEAQLTKALATAPREFSARARNPENDIMVGGQHFALGATGGAPSIMEPSGELRPSLTADYEKFTKLIQTSPLNLYMTCGVCFPSDLDASTAHLSMMRMDALNTDRVLMGPTASAEKAEDFIHVLEIIFGKESLEKGPVSINVVNAASPLKIAEDQSEVIITLAKHNQPIVVTNMMMLGATGPITVPGALALGNAEILSGIVLAQLVRPGVAVVYGSTSCPMDMKSMVAVLGTPEAVWMSRGTQGLADFYHLPCRTGGSLTDSHLPDAEALIDGTIMFQNALFNGANFIFHSVGMLSSYMAASFEKFVIDEEMVLFSLATLDPPAVNEASINVKLLEEVGSHGSYLTRPETVKNFRKLFRSKFLNRAGYEAWSKAGGHSASQQASSEVARRLAAWEKPAMDPAMEKELEQFFQRRAKELAK